MSMDTYLKILGWHRKDPSDPASPWETEAANHERMSGILSLYAAIVQTPLPGTPTDDVVPWASGL